MHSFFVTLMETNGCQLKSCTLRIENENLLMYLLENLLTVGNLKDQLKCIRIAMLLLLYAIHSCWYGIRVLLARLGVG